MENKSGEEIIKTISENVGRMLSRKMDAVKCLYKKAELMSQDWNDTTRDNLTYYSAKYSNATIENELKTANIPSNMEEGASDTYL